MAVRKKTVNQRVRFAVNAEPRSKVFVAGTFNSWDPQANPLRENGKAGTYSATLLLPPGRHEYKFVVNGVWRIDPNCSEWVGNQHGSLNNVISV